MSNGALASRKIAVGDRWWNIEIVAALPMCFINLTVADYRSGKRRQIVEWGEPVMFGPGFWVEIARDGRERHQVFGTCAHAGNNGTAAGVADQLHGGRTKLPGYPVRRQAHAIDDYPAVPVERPPSLLTFLVRRGPEITGPSQVNGGVGRVVHEAQQHRVGRRRIHSDASLVDPRRAITVHINAQMASWSFVPQDEMPKPSGIEPARFEAPFDGKLLPGRAQDTSRHSGQAGSGNKQESQALKTRQSAAGAVRLH